MHGYQLTFFMQQNRRHGGRVLADWLLQEARRMELGGATLIAAAEGFGQHRTMHAAHFIELGDQPLEVTMAVSSEDAERFLKHLKEEGVDVFFSKAAIEFGSTCE